MIDHSQRRRQHGTALVLGVGAVAFLLTSFVGTCPVYLHMGLSTRHEQRS
ncbi:DUF2892 domain-containing protein [Salinibacter ruber]|nr:hypothetical protein [Salinibacter ruber]